MNYTFYTLPLSNKALIPMKQTLFNPICDLEMMNENIKKKHPLFLDAGGKSLFKVGLVILPDRKPQIVPCQTSVGSNLIITLTGSHMLICFPHQRLCGRELQIAQNEL